MDEFSLSSDLFLDIIFLVVIGISIGLGLFRGLVRELLSLLAWVLAGWMAYLYSAQLAEVLLRWLDAPRLSFLVSPVLVFLGTLVALSIMGRLVYQLFRIGGLTTMDRSFGAIFGLVRALTIIVVFIVVVRAVGATEAPWFVQSKIAKVLAPVVEPLKYAVLRRISDPLRTVLEADQSAQPKPENP